MFLCLVLIRSQRYGSANVSNKIHHHSPPLWSPRFRLSPPHLAVRCLIVRVSMCTSSIGPSIGVWSLLDWPVPICQMCGMSWRSGDPCRVNYRVYWWENTEYGIEDSIRCVVCRNLEFGPFDGSVQHDIDSCLHPQSATQFSAQLSISTLYHRLNMSWFRWARRITLNTDLVKIGNPAIVYDERCL